MSSDKDDISAKLRQCVEELAALETRRQELERNAERAARTSHNLEAEAGRLEAKVEELTKELADRSLLISQLERLGSSLREEAMELRWVGRGMGSTSTRCDRANFSMNWLRRCEKKILVFCVKVAEHIPVV
jgi:chromosome segregation ATPase